MWNTWIDPWCGREKYHNIESKLHHCDQYMELHFTYTAYSTRILSNDSARKILLAIICGLRELFTPTSAIIGFITKKSNNNELKYAKLCLRPNFGPLLLSDRNGSATSRLRTDTNYKHWTLGELNSHNSCSSWIYNKLSAIILTKQAGVDFLQKRELQSDVAQMVTQ